MVAIVDTCRIADFMLFLMFHVNIESLIIWWATPIAIYLTPGWEVHVQRIIALLMYTAYGLYQLQDRIRHATGFVDYLFSVTNCPEARRDRIISFAWNASLQFFSFFTWSPMTWCSRMLDTPSSAKHIKAIKFLFLAPIQLWRAIVWVLVFVTGHAYRICFLCIVPLLNIFVVPFSLFVSIIAIFLLVFYAFMVQPTDIPLKSRESISKARTIFHSCTSFHHVLQVLGPFLAFFGSFSSRDRWFRRAALNSGNSSAVRATLPGLIGPIDVDEDDLLDACRAIRGIHNIWTRLNEQEALLDDKSTIIYALSYKHIPVFENGKQIRISEERAMEILRYAMLTAKKHGYKKFMLWCDGASACGAYTENAWMDIGLLPYAIYRTLRVNTCLNSTSLTVDRLWLELEKELSSLTCGMDVLDEYIYERNVPDGDIHRDVSYYPDESVRGKGYSAVAAVLRLSLKIIQRDYDHCDVSWKEDRKMIAGWARNILMRSGLYEMHEKLGWTGNPSNDRRAKTLLTRVATFAARDSNEKRCADLAHVGEPWGEFSHDRTEFWIALLGYSKEEMETMENESLDSFSARFSERNTGNWEMVASSLQGDYYVYIVAFRNLSSKEELSKPMMRYYKTSTDEWIKKRMRKEKDWMAKEKEELKIEMIRAKGWWLLTSSQIEKAEVAEWTKKLVSEMFEARALDCFVENIESDCKKPEGSDSGVSWFFYGMKETAAWYRTVAANIRERKRLEDGPLAKC